MIKKTVAVVAIISACLLVWTMATQWRDCADDGKAFVRGALWFECVAR